MSRKDLDGVAVAGPSTTLWRYMSLSKLLQMLQSRTIWFSRVDQLLADDPYEGSLPFNLLESERSPKREAVTEKKHGMTAGSVAQMRKTFLETFKNQRERTFVSCWHSGSTDNDAMWRLYGAEKDGSVCVRSTVSLLSRELPSFISVGRVEYVNYEDQWLGNSSIYVPFFRKRTCFEHEREVRFLFNTNVDDLELSRKPGKDNTGWAVNFSPEVCLTNIFISPTAPSWFREVVEGALRELEMDITVCEAPMAKRPIF